MKCFTNFTASVDESISFNMFLTALSLSIFLTYITAEQVLSYNTKTYLNIKGYRILMSEVYSENNFHPHREQCNIDESFVIAPIKLNPNKANPTHFKTKSDNPKVSLGQYEQYKLTPYIRPINVLDDSETGLTYTQNTREGRPITVINIDPDSHVIQIREEFTQLMTKYISNQVAFMAVGGNKGSGKSLFCDKILNLAEVKGNHLWQRGQAAPGLYTYSNPFTKDGLCIFWLEVSGCELNSNLYMLLNALAMILSSSYVFVEDCAARADTHWEQFQECLQRSVKLFELGDQERLFPHTLYCLVRSNEAVRSPPESPTPFFTDYQTLCLSDAMTPGYRGKKEDLVSFSFLAKQCVNPQYIKELHTIFLKVYKDTEGKLYGELPMRGNIADKILSATVANLNSNKKIKLPILYDNIMKELYVTAFNYCVMVYHEQLQKQFEDEQPKNTDEMYRIFERASTNALEKFNDYSVNQPLHQQFEQKLIAHIDAKQSLLCTINKQKTIEILKSHFSQLPKNQPPHLTLAALRTYKPELDDGRTEAMADTLLELLGNPGMGAQAELLRKLDELSKRHQELQEECREAEESRNQQQQEIQKTANLISDLKEQESRLDAGVANLEEEIETLTRRLNKLQSGEGDASEIEELKRQCDKLKANRQTEGFNFIKFQNSKNEQIKELTERYQQRINNTINRQKEVQKELQQAEAQVKANPKDNPKQPKTKSKSKNKSSSELESVPRKAKAKS